MLPCGVWGHGIWSQSRSMTIYLSLCLRVPLKPHHLSWSPERDTHVQGVSREHLSTLLVGSYSPTPHMVSRCCRLLSQEVLGWDRQVQKATPLRRHRKEREPSLWSLKSPVQNFCAINIIALTVTVLTRKPHSFYREIFLSKNAKLAMSRASFRPEQYTPLEYG